MINRERKMSNLLFYDGYEIFKEIVLVHVSFVKITYLVFAIAHYYLVNSILNFVS